MRRESYRLSGSVAMLVASFALCSLLLLSTNQANSQVIQSSPKSVAKDFYVELVKKKEAFYADEPVGLTVFRRNDKESQSTNCSFGGLGQELKVWRNDKLIRTSPLGPVSMTRILRIGNVIFSYFGTSVFPGNFLDSNVDTEDTYTITATCGDEVSEPSHSFRIESWLQPVGGLQVKLRSSKNVYLAGEPIVIEATVRNVGTVAVLCPLPAGDDGFQKSFWRFAANGNLLQDPRPSLPEALLYSVRLNVLRPGESQTTPVTLNSFQLINKNGADDFGRAQGRYSLSAAVYFHDNPPLTSAVRIWRGEMTSNVIEIVVQ